MSLVYLAYHEMGCMGLRSLLARGVAVDAVYTYDEDPGENCWFGSVAELAREAGIPTYTSVKINAPETIEQIRSVAPDVILSVYFRDMVGKHVRAIPRYGAFNLHGSLDNNSTEGKVRLSCDARYQLAADPIDERWIGENPIGHGAGYSGIGAAQPLTAPPLYR